MQQQSTLNPKPQTRLRLQVTGAEAAAEGIVAEGVFGAGAETVRVQAWVWLMLPQVKAVTLQG